MIASLETLSHPRQVMLNLVLAGIVAVVAAIVALEVPVKNEQPYQCDPFGYLRQAMLFEEQGLWHGLDTRLETPVARQLIDTAIDLELQPVVSAFVVAPMCHNYKEETDRIVTQYPPGEGFLLSLYAEGQRIRGLQLTVVSLTAIASLILVMVSTTPLLAVSGAGLGVMMQLLYVHHTGYLSATPTMALCVLSAGLSVWFLSAGSTAVRAGLAVAIGLTLGFATDLRIASVLLLPGYAVALAVLLRHDGAVRAMMFTSLASAAWLMAIMPTLMANAINAGSVLATTYAGGDATPPSFDAGVLANSARHYFTEGRGAVMVWIAVVAVIASVAVRRHLPGRLAFAIPAAAATNLVVGSGFFLTHAITTHYYLLPTAVWCAWVVWFALAAGKLANPLRDRMRGVACSVWAAAALGLAFLIDLPREDGFETGEPVPSDAMVWALLKGGLFVMERGVHSANPTYGGGVAGRRLIDALAQDGVPQYFLADSSAMRALIADLEAQNRLERVGEAYGDALFRLVH